MRREAITLVFAMGIGSVLMAIRDEPAQQAPASKYSPAATRSKSPAKPSSSFAWINR